MIRFLALALASITLIAPAAAIAQPHYGGGIAHLRPAMFHDRSTHAHVHMLQPHH